MSVDVGAVGFAVVREPVHVHGAVLLTRGVPAPHAGKGIEVRGARFTHVGGVGVRVLGGGVPVRDLGAPAGAGGGRGGGGRAGATLAWESRRAVERAITLSLVVTTTRRHDP